MTHEEIISAIQSRLDDHAADQRRAIDAAQRERAAHQKILGKVHEKVNNVDKITVEMRADYRHMEQKVDEHVALPMHNGAALKFQEHDARLNGQDSGLKAAVKMIERDREERARSAAYQEREERASRKWWRGQWVKAMMWILAPLCGAAGLFVAQRLFGS